MSEAYSTIADYLHSYRDKGSAVSDEQWLATELQRSNPEMSPQECLETAGEIVHGIGGYRESSRNLSSRLSAGGTRTDFIRDALSTAARAAGVTNLGAYFSSIDAALGKANRDLWSRVVNHIGDKGEHGYIFEELHAGVFNARAAAAESSSRASVLRMDGQHEPGSPDIKLDDANGTSTEYNAKCCYSAAQTRADSAKQPRGSQKTLVCEEQVDAIPGSVGKIHSSDGIESDSYTYQEMQEIKNRVNRSNARGERENIVDYDSVDMEVLARGIGRNIVRSGLMAIGFQAARIVGRRLWNALTGKPNQTAEEDVAEFVDSAGKSGAMAVTTTALAGGLEAAARKGLLGVAMKSTPAGVIANLACVAVENVKVLNELGNGKLTTDEAIDKVGNANCSLVGALAGAAKGFELGAAVGSVVPGIGTAVCGTVGAMAGAATGSSIGHAVWEGAKSIGRAVSRAFTSVCKTVSSVFSKLFA